MLGVVDAEYLKKRIARLKRDIANWTALQQSHREAIQESRTPAQRTASENELRRTTQMIANVKYEIAEMEKVLRGAK